MKVVCLMGPTASGKTPLAIELRKYFPFEIVSVDSAMVYRGMDIGTAKPDRATLQQAPHALIDLLEPNETYSAGDFCRDAMREIHRIHSAGRVPLLVGGTMMYFRALQVGLAPLPQANEALRQQLQLEISKKGLSSLHERLQLVDPEAAASIEANDSQRIQRALEVYALSNKPISQWQKENQRPLAGFDVINIALMPKERKSLHEKIERRFDLMLQQGFLDEVKTLYARNDLSVDMPSLRSVGYRQVWAYLSGELDVDQMRLKAIAATRQLAKRQLTWLRSWPELECYDSEDAGLLAKVKVFLQERLGSA